MNAAAAPVCAISALSCAADKADSAKGVIRDTTVMLLLPNVPMALTVKADNCAGLKAAAASPLILIAAMAAIWVVDKAANCTGCQFNNMSEPAPLMAVIWLGVMATICRGVKKRLLTSHCKVAGRSAAICAGVRA